MSIWYSISPSDSDLMHYGRKGQKWGIRRYQNKDGSLTAEGRLRYQKGSRTKLSDEEFNEALKKRTTDLGIVNNQKYIDDTGELIRKYGPEPHKNPELSAKYMAESQKRMDAAKEKINAANKKRAALTRERYEKNMSSEEYIDRDLEIYGKEVKPYQKIVRQEEFTQRFLTGEDLTDPEIWRHEIYPSDDSEPTNPNPIQRKTRKYINVPIRIPRPKRRK